ncbi:MAG: proline racemase family protein, partial [Longimicrobiales bacterium]|nr:proline racemase family protein [Longimicrobiales bacterium]
MTDWPDGLEQWVTPEGWKKILAVDAHAEGEPLRVIVDGFPHDGFPRDARGGVRAWRRAARERHDELRRALLWEPRGHADMYGCVVGPPVSPDADVSVLVIHNAGFSTMCGHGVIAVTTVLLETGLASRVSGEGVDPGQGEGDDERSLGIDTPAGLVVAHAAMEGKRVAGVRFRNVPSFVLRLDAEVDVPAVGPVRYDLAYGGAFYAYVSAEALGVELSPAEVPRLIEVGRSIKATVQRADPPSHPDSDDLGFLYGTIFVGEGRVPGSHSRNVCVFADGEVDRSPTGTGVSGRLALHHARGELEEGQRIVVESVLGTRFSGRIVGRSRVGPHDAVVPEVGGRAWITGVNR